MAKGDPGGYRSWRRDLPILYQQDIDQIEYKIVDGEFIPLALVEESLEKEPIRNPKAFFDVANRKRIAQYGVSRMVAKALGVPAWMLFYDLDLTEFWTIELTKKGALPERKKPEEWIEYLAGLR